MTNKKQTTNNNKINSAFAALDNAYYFNSDGPFSAVSDNKNGKVVLAFKTKEFAKIFISENEDAIQSRGQQINNIKITPVKDGLKFMQLCASNGNAGIELIDEDDQSTFIFCVTLDNISAEYPDALVCATSTNYFIKTKTTEYSEKKFKTIKEWQRFDILDKGSSQLAVNSPFKEGKELKFFEIRTLQNDFIAIQNIPCRGKHNQMDGSIPFFTKEKAAYQYADHLQAKEYIEFGQKTKFNKSASTREFDDDDYKIIQINDLKDRLNEIKNVFIDFVINPNGSRDETVYGTCFLDKDKSRYLLHGVSGTWILGDKNQIKKKSDRDGELKNDTFYWNGISRYTLNPLKKSKSPVSKSLKISEKELEKHLKQIFKEDIKEVNFTSSSRKEKEINFYMSCWDANTGNPIKEATYYKSFKSVIEWLWQIEVCEDYPNRTNRKERLYHFYEFPDSKVSQRDKANQLTHNIIKDQLMRIYKACVLNGYSPKLSEDLSALVNSYYRTLQIDLLGYWQDLLLQTEGKEKTMLEKKFK